MDLFFISRARVQERPESFGGAGEEAVRRLDFRALPDRLPVIVDDQIRPVEPACSWFRHLFRAKAVLADWDAHIEAHGSRTPGEARRDADIDDLRRQLAAAKKEITALNRQLTAADGSGHDHRRTAPRRPNAPNRTRRGGHPRRLPVPAATLKTHTCG